MEKIVELVVKALYVEGEHHKQWYLEQILSLLVNDEDALKKLRIDMLIEEEYLWEEGIAP